MTNCEKYNNVVSLPTQEKSEEKNSVTHGNYYSNSDANGGG